MSIRNKIYATITPIILLAAILLSLSYYNSSSGAKTLEQLIRESIKKESAHAVKNYTDLAISVSLQFMKKQMPMTKQLKNKSKHY